MKRLLLTLSILSVAGCSTYYRDPYYSDRYYDRRHADRYYYGDGYDVGRRYGYSSWYYDLYDPYSALFLPLGYLYDPWYWNSYRFGVDRYPSRFWSFNFYGGRPWYYSPWYGGYGIYHPYGYSHHPRPRRDGVPSYVVTHGGESAQAAARGLAAEVHGMSTADGNSLVRSNAVRVNGGSDGSELLGTMATPSTTINGIRAGRYDATSVQYRTQGVPGGFARDRQYDDGGSRFDNRDGSISIGRAGFRDQGMPSGWRNSTRVESINGMPASQFDSNPGAQSGQGIPGGQRYQAPGSSDRPLTGADHPWRDAQPIGSGAAVNSMPGPARGFRNDGGMGIGQPRFERSERSFPGSSARSASDFGGSRGSAAESSRSAGGSRQRENDGQ